ncbi:MAG TPA: hypothetical protein VK133_01315 [Amoebophilaceae bacterium]|nr:hypothetical protein [Amoebophilaceae bacterium]
MDGTICLGSHTSNKRRRPIAGVQACEKKKTIEAVATSALGQIQARAYHTDLLQHPHIREIKPKMDTRINDNFQVLNSASSF